MKSTCLTFFSILFCLPYYFINYLKFLIANWTHFLWRGSIKLPLSVCLCLWVILSVCLSVCLCVCLCVCLSVYPSISLAFSQKCVFNFFLILEHLKPDRALFSKKIHFCPNLGRKGPKWPQNRVIWIYCKILPLFFTGNNLKGKLILLLIFHHQSHV